jgi:catechol 2,3-dioxygenase-like lactoylglutathione lyase family enzyme
MIQARRLGHATFETSDLEKSIAYYTQVCGLTLTAREKSHAFLATKLGQLAVQLVQGSATRCIKLSFEVAPGEDFAAMQRDLAHENIKNETRSDAVPGIARTLAFQDPKGTTIELFSQAGFLDSDRSTGGVMPLKLGHIAFVVSDPKAMADFYQRVLGFRVSDWIEDFFVFLRCNSDHHAVNFIKGGKIDIHHFAFELQNFAQLEGASDWLGKRRIPIVWGPVRLGPGHNVAIFHRNADDQVVEFYAELDQLSDEALGHFDPKPWHRDRPQWPKVWARADSSIWGLPPTPDFFRGRD